MKLMANKIYFSHFGASNRVQEYLQIAVDKLQAWSDIIAKAVRENAIDTVTERIKAWVYAELEPIRKRESLYEFMTNILVPSSVAAHVKYHQENLG